MLHRLRRSEEGYVLITALIALAVMAILAAVAISQANSALRTASHAVTSEQALYLANAGLEDALARVRAEQEVAVGDSWNGSVTLQPGLDGRYDVLILADSDPAFIRVRSVGTVEGETRQLTARLALPATEEPPPEPDSPPVIYQQALLSIGGVEMLNGAKVCGQVISPNVIDLAEIKVAEIAADCGLPADTIRFTSGVEVVGKKLANSQVCSPKQYGDDYACSTAPVINPPPPLDLEWLKSHATHWYVKNVDRDCKAAPAGTLCQDVTSLDLSGLTSPALVYVDGDLILANDQEVSIPSQVTLVYSGTVSLGNNAELFCQGESPCQVAILAQGEVTLGNNSQFHASVHTASKFTASQNAKVYGNILANPAIVENNVIIKPPSYDPAATPPGLIMTDGSYTGGSGSGDPGGGTPPVEEELILPSGFDSWGP